MDNRRKTVAVVAVLVVVGLLALVITTFLGGCLRSVALAVAGVGGAWWIAQDMRKSG